MNSAEEYAHRLKDLSTGAWTELSGRVRPALFERRVTEQELRRILRPHWEEPIENPEELNFRDSLDQSLEFLQMLELAVETGYVPEEFAREKALSEFNGLLWSVAARDYVEMYGFLLVRFLAARFEIGGWRSQIEKVPDTDALAQVRFGNFVAVCEAWATNPCLKLFTQFMDDYYFEHRLNAQFIGKFLEDDRAKGELSPKEGELVTMCLDGMVSFLTTLTDFFESLQESERPRFGSFFAYWLGRFFGFRVEWGEYKQEGFDWKPMVWLLDKETSPERGSYEGRAEEWKRQVQYLETIWLETREWIGRFPVRKPPIDLMRKIRFKQKDG
jgi:hypothetical protein